MVVHLFRSWQDGVPVLFPLHFDFWAFLLLHRPAHDIIGRQDP